MGNFYVNHVVFDADRDAVISELRNNKRNGYCSELVGGNVYIYDQESECQDPDVITKLGLSLSSALDCCILAALNHDDDILALWSFESGHQLDAYNSTPNYFGDQGEVQGGDATVIARIANVIANASAIEEILRDTTYVFAFERHWALAKALSLDPNLCVCGATSLERGDVSPTIIETIRKL